MDPNANLEELRALVRAANEAHDQGEAPAPEDAERMAELVEALDGWLSKGGFLPKAWEPVRIAAALHEVSPPGDGSHAKQAALITMLMSERPVCRGMPFCTGLPHVLSCLRYVHEHTRNCPPDCKGDL